MLKYALYYNTYNQRFNVTQMIHRTRILGFFLYKGHRHLQTKSQGMSQNRSEDMKPVN